MPLDRPWFRDALAAETAEAHLRAHVAGTRKVLERVAPITEVVAAAAATDPDVAELWQYDEDPRFTVQSAAARSLMAKPGASADVSPEGAADVLYGLLGPELFLLFVRDRGWSPQRWERWVLRALRTQLCDV
ncbi:hypothetical protein [Pseudonocardia nigra]|uniref:hypothetical protein n=1 Tax=Pseudonocardia nigra TaxID=1921578 RepID=UPI001C5CD5ED|nr:hypothetical protein [Pseudonocardia nigra]